MPPPSAKGVTRRDLLKWGGRAALASLVAPALASCLQDERFGVALPDRVAWDDLDNAIRHWWNDDIEVALEADVLADPNGTLLYLPHPYLTPASNEGTFAEMYGWDTFFINLGLFAHNRLDLVQNHILNHLYMVEQYGKVLNGNRTYYLGRSQPPLLADTVRRFLEAGGESNIAKWAYPLLEREYNTKLKQ